MVIVPITNAKTTNNTVATNTIHEDGMVAGGSVLTRDVPPEEIWLGSPAKSFNKVPDKQLLKNNLDKPQKEKE